MEGVARKLNGSQELIRATKKLNGDYRMVWVVRNLNGSKRKTRTAKEKSIDVQKNGKECFFAGICSQTVVFNQYTIGHPFKLFIDNLPEFFSIISWSISVKLWRIIEQIPSQIFLSFMVSLQNYPQGHNLSYSVITLDLTIFSSKLILMKFFLVRRFLYTSSIFGCTAFFMGPISGVRKFCCSFLYFTMIY